MYQLTLLLIIAHLLGDFVFQNNKMVSDIYFKRFKSKSLYIHGFIHFILIILLSGFKTAYIFPAFLLAISHLLIDMLTKLYLRNKVKDITNFLIDQFLHLLSIFVFISCFYKYTINYSELLNLKNQTLFISLISITFVSSIIIKKVIDFFDSNISTSGLKDAGKYIGMLERAFVFLFVINNFWEGIGFLLAAKSIFRIGDLKDPKDVRLTEYILIGTLLSFGLAIVIGLIYLKMISYI